MFVLRVVVGLLFVGHGTQKLFGWFGGHGVEGTGGFFESLGYRPGKPHAVLAGIGEAGGGALLAVGLLTPLAAAAIVGVMVNAIVSVHIRNGVWVTDNGFEYPLVLVAAVLAPVFAGAGDWSLDRALGWDLGGVGWGLAALIAGILAGTATLLARTTGAEAAAGSDEDEEEQVARAA